MIPQAYFPVTGRARFALTGPDAARYLNGQLSIDISALSPLAARPACLLTAKGKLCAVVLVFRNPHGFVVECDASLAEAVFMRLERYLVADDAQWEALPTPVGWFHVLGPPPPETPLVNRLGPPGFDCFMPPANLPLLEPPACEDVRIRHGLPVWGAELDEDTLPHEAALELTAVDFNKGCYVGQETVSRLQSVGRVNRRLRGFQAGISLRPGWDLVAPDQPESRAGCLTSTSSYFGIASTVALGYVHRSFDDSPRLLVRDDLGQMIGEVERRPFPIL